MTNTAITIQQANTTDGSYDVRVALPKPVTLEAGEPRTVYLGHPTNRGPAIGTLMGTVDQPGSMDLEHMTGLPDVASELVGRFLVIAEADGIYADTRVIERIVSVTEGAR